MNVVAYGNSLRQLIIYSLAQQTLNKSNYENKRTDDDKIFFYAQYGLNGHHPRKTYRITTLSEQRQQMIGAGMSAVVSHCDPCGDWPLLRHETRMKA